MSAPSIRHRTVPFHGLWLAAFKYLLVFSVRCVGRDSRSGAAKRLRFDSNHTEPNPLALTLRVFQACFLCEPSRFEGLRQRRELSIDKLEE